MKKLPKDHRFLLYCQLLKASKRALLTLQVARIDGLRHTSNGIKVDGIYSRLYLHGSRAPETLEQLFTFHNLHLMRRKWMDKLFPYFEPFIPGITKQKMWSAILYQRERYQSTKAVHDKRDERDSFRVWRDDESFHKFIDCKGREHADRYPRVRNLGHNRIFPMLSHKYVAFMLKVCKNKDRKRYFEERFHVNVSHYDLNYNKTKDMDIQIRNGQGVVLDKVAIADNIYTFNYGEDFRLMIADGKLFFHDVPGISYTLGRNYVDKKDEEELRHGYSGTELGEDYF